MANKSAKIKAVKVEGRYSRWIRKYTESIHDPKIVSLTDRQYRVWDIVLLIAGKHPDGILPPIQDVACDLRCTVVEAQAVIDELIMRGLIDIVRRAGDSITLRPHNWDQRQFKSDTSTDRVRAHRNKHETFHETDCNVSPSDSVSVSVLSIQGSKNATYQTRETWPTSDDEVPL